MIASGADLLRFLTLPLFAYVALLDVRTRRVPTWVWYPILAIGLIALVWDGLRVSRMGGFAWTLWSIRVAISLGIIAPLGYLFWRLGAFGKADAKALGCIAVLFPTFPTIVVGAESFPYVVSEVGVFSVTVLMNAVVLGFAYPLALAAVNGVRGRFHPAMFVGLPVHWSSLERRHGKLLEGTGGFSRHGLDLDALRMYLRWRGCQLADIRDDPLEYRDPASVSFDPSHPGDGRVRPDGGEGVASDDPWGARAFISSTESPYGTRAEELRATLSMLSTREYVWLSPGIPFLVLVVFGLLLGLFYGDVLTTVLTGIG